MVRDERTYVKVHDGIEDHPRVAPLSDKAFRLLVTTWGWCSRHLTDGRVPLAVWRQRGTPRARKELEVELVHHDGHDCARCPQPGPQHVVMHDYLNHQRSADEVEAKRSERRKAGVLGNHRRWHQEKSDPDCPHCIANGSQMRSHKGSQTVSQRDRKTSPETETETEVHIPGETWGGGVTLANASDSRPPDHCNRHPGGTNEPCRACADARRSAEEWDAAELARAEAIARDIEQAKADPRQRCEHGHDGGRFPHPRTGQSATCALCRRAQRQEAS